MFGRLDKEGRNAPSSLINRHFFNYLEARTAFFYGTDDLLPRFPRESKKQFEAKMSVSLAKSLVLLMPTNYCAHFKDHAPKPQAISQWLDWKASDGQAEVGDGVQRLLGLHG